MVVLAAIRRPGADLSFAGTDHALRPVPGLPLYHGTRGREGGLAKLAIRHLPRHRGNYTPFAPDLNGHSGWNLSSGCEGLALLGSGRSSGRQGQRGTSLAIYLRWAGSRCRMEPLLEAAASNGFAWIRRRDRVHLGVVVYFWDERFKHWTRICMLRDGRQRRLRRHRLFIAERMMRSRSSQVGPRTRYARASGSRRSRPARGVLGKRRSRLRWSGEERARAPVVRASRLLPIYTPSSRRSDRHGADALLGERPMAEAGPAPEAHHQSEPPLPGRARWG